MPVSSEKSRDRVRTLAHRRLVLMENRMELEVATVLGLTPVAVGNFFTFVRGPVDWVAPWVPYKPSGGEAVFKSFETNTEYLLSLARGPAARRRLDAA